MHHYGGGYSDIKIPNGSWLKAFEEMNKNENIWINGYPESEPAAIAHRPAADLWQKLPGNGRHVLSANKLHLRKNGLKNKPRS
jgi:hypothetical protein